WVEVQVDNLTCTQYWVQYLRLLQESIWPGGVLPGVPKPLRTEEQKAETKEQALRSLMAILPELEPCLRIHAASKHQQAPQTTSIMTSVYGAAERASTSVR
ncbi:hypothetical protein E2320_007127, partial [Naja naja]